MHSYQSYCERKSSAELQGFLWSYCIGAVAIADEGVLTILDILRSRDALDPETEAKVTARLQAPAIPDDRKPLSFFILR